MKKLNNLDDLILFLNKNYMCVFELDRYTTTNLIIKNSTYGIDYVIYEYPGHTLVESSYSELGETLYLCLISSCMDLLHLIVSDMNIHFNVNNNYMFNTSYKDYLFYEELLCLG